MTKSGTCMNSCPMPEQNAYRASYPLKLQWYKANKPAALRRRVPFSSVVPSCLMTKPEPSLLSDDDDEVSLDQGEAPTEASPPGPPGS
ncbi:hypothetical protein BGZ81_003866 [Podila clonocystis]|nr:hypothetical protein BGZ81_003866 [Podila clonocystis]